jgi:hypothetical protein
MKSKIINLSMLVALILQFSCSSNKMGLGENINASVLGDEYASDIQKGDKKYKGKYLTVSGEISQAYLNKYQENILILIDKNKNQGVRCTLIKSNKTLDKPFKLGEIIKVNGKCAGFDEYVLLTGCIILKD